MPEYRTPGVYIEERFHLAHVQFKPLPQRKPAL